MSGPVLLFISSSIFKYETYIPKKILIANLTHKNDPRLLEDDTVTIMNTRELREQTQF